MKINIEWTKKHKELTEKSSNDHKTEWQCTLKVKVKVGLHLKNGGFVSLNLFIDFLALLYTVPNCCRNSITFHYHFSLSSRHDRNNKIYFQLNSGHTHCSRIEFGEWNWTSNWAKLPLFTKKAKKRSKPIRIKWLAVDTYFRMQINNDDASSGSGAGYKLIRAVSRAQCSSWAALLGKLKCPFCSALVFLITEPTAITTTPVWYSVNQCSTGSAAVPLYDWRILSHGM